MILPPGFKHVVVDISAHGFGHLAQTAAVINELKLDENNVKLTVRSMADEATLRERIRHESFDLIKCPLDNGMVMYDALRVDADKTMEWYNDFHGNYASRVSDAARELEALEPDLLFSNVPYLGLDALAAATELVQVPSVALCSLNWADIFLSYCGEYPGAKKIHDEILGAYSQADVFLQPTPSMPMHLLSNTHSVAPIALKGISQPEILRSLIGIQDDIVNTKFVLIGVGGVGIKGFPLNTWPRIPNVYWIFPDAVLDSSSVVRRHDFVGQSHFDRHMRYIDLLASCSLVITKTGYGTQTEAVVNQVPSICIERLDWPEHVNLRDWHETHGEVVFMDWADIRKTRRFEAVVMDMLGKEDWPKTIVDPTGAKEAAAILHQYL
uniref:Glycosyl transferase family 28 C-terminal domain-containing protein n=1 Tax=Attheya septentrionalis TaxID=420275 RepID=A0A7S2UIV5_9STRA|mmetsp:Transcript_24407/g.44140  ORF Transcript_24407/g.44140 Transcript_24407/m.44140 type:complete len:382 (+) Transcript_24407:134-1279(+)|eukprot:CAMPEP_0198295626 /NCGR_PEP_ID=MMETSP1449-20131203/28757_1 /TAXON_ID=420275 /ORGANISM="Attheya septentrionalis, Strain CCMP2084" /LENGTH=381 /DNA_ID=CAMNT_0043995995 /DNA_START=103 /DNA_END=1248 /DNA_ORIENTATION=+